MASVDARIQAVLQCLQATFDANQSIRNAAEVRLAEEAKLEGFGPILCRIILAQELPYGIRQLAAVVLKKLVKEHWQQDDRGYQPPTVSNSDKQVIRQQLLPGLADANSKIRTAVGMAVAAIAKKDWPYDWPSLMESLIGAIKERSNPALVHGVLRCLSLLSGDIDETQLPQIVPMLLPELNAIVSSTEYTPAIQCKALSILHGVVSSLATMTGAAQRQVRDLLAPLMQPWMGTLNNCLATDSALTDPSTWGSKLEALKILVQLVLYFGKFVVPYMPGLLRHCWAMFLAGLPLYQQRLVLAGGEQEGEQEEPEFNEEGEPRDLEALLAQMFELLLTLLGSQRFQKQLRPAFHDMAYITTGYMQMTAAQAEAWADNPNEYIADEEEQAFTVRVSGELLLDELVGLFGKECLSATLDAVQCRMEEADKTKGSGADGWWQLREAALLALGASHGHLEQAVAAAARGSQINLTDMAAAAASNPLLARVHGFLSAMLQHDLGLLLQPAAQQQRQQQNGGGDVNAFLAGRALWAGAKLAALMRPDHVEAFLYAACTGVRAISNMPAPVRIGSCCVIAVLVPRLASRPASYAKLQPLLGPLYEGLLLLLQESSEETLHLVLETLTVVVKADSSMVQQVLPVLLPLVVQVWSQNVADPLIADDALNVLRHLAKNQACLEPLTQQVLPTLAQIIASPQHQPPMLVEGCMDFLGLLTRPGSKPVVQAVYQAVNRPLLQLLMTSDDAGILQGASQLLCELVRSGGEELLTWGGREPVAELQQLLAVTSRLLSTSMGESESQFVGSIVYDLITAFPGRIVPVFGQILEAVVMKLVSSNMSTLVGGLLLVMCKLCHLNVQQLVEALAAMRVALPGQERQVSALEAVLPLWLERHADIHGSFKSGLCTTALGLLLESRHPKLMQVMVPGRRLDLAGGVRTRSQAACSGSEQWSRVAAPVKVVMVLAEQLADLQEHGTIAHYTDEDEDEDEGELDDGEGDEDAEHEDHMQHAADVMGLNAAGLKVQGAAFTSSQNELLEMLLHNSRSLEQQQEEDDMDSHNLNDPLAHLDLSQYLSDLFRRLAMQEQGLLNMAAPELTPQQTAVLQQLLQQSRLQA